MAAKRRPAPSPPPPAESDSLIERLTEIRAQMIAFEGKCAKFLSRLDPAWQVSGRNLVHYLSLRQHDLRTLQDSLATLGLSSLGRSEGGVLATLDALLTALRCLAGREAVEHPAEPVSLAQGREILADHAAALLGPAPAARSVRVMVTIPGEAATDYPLIRDLLLAGMDCMRINCAHDDAETWSRIIEHLRQARKEVGRPCRVLMDLGGPKLRTGPMPPGPRVVKIRPLRDELGHVLEPARIWLTSMEGAPGKAIRIPVDAGWLKLLRPGGRVTLRDTRGAKRSWTVESVSDSGCLARSDQTCYVATGTVLIAAGAGSRKKDRRTVVGNLPARETRLELSPGQRLTVFKEDRPGRLTPPEIGCTLPEVFESVKVGEPIWFDDGKLGGIIREVAADQFIVEITSGPAGFRLGAAKGINLPDTNLHLPPLTARDLEDLKFVAAHADLVGYSFVRSAEDILELQSRLQEVGGSHLGVILKIETRRAFEHLPELLLAAMRSPAVGVMIARGDLAVECGFERLAELQEEILWLCEAAHAPVVWATQVLETLARTGQPSRAEVTDAAMGVRAECVMLNKGRYVVDAVRVLDDILRRMEAHTRKKRSLLRQLKVALSFASKK